MTVEQFGLQVIAKYKERGIDYSDRQPEAVAHRYLQVYPQCWELVDGADGLNRAYPENLVPSPLAGSYGRVLRSPTTVVHQHLIFPDEVDADATKTLTEAQSIAIQNIATAEAALQASSRGLPLDAWPEIAKSEFEHRHRLAEQAQASRLKVYEAAMERDIGLDGDQRIRLHEIWELSEIRTRLRQLHVERHGIEVGRQPESVKRECLHDIDVEIQRLRGVLNGLETMDEGSGDRLPDDSESADTSGGSEVRPQEDQEQVSPSHPGIGFRRPGDAS